MGKSDGTKDRLIHPGQTCVEARCQECFRPLKVVCVIETRLTFMVCHKCKLAVPLHEATCWLLEQANAAAALRS